MTSLVSLGAAGNTAGFRGRPGAELSITQPPSFPLHLQFLNRHRMLGHFLVGVICRVESLLRVYNVAVYENEINLSVVYLKLYKEEKNWKTRRVSFWAPTIWELTC